MSFFVIDLKLLGEEFFVNGEFLLIWWDFVDIVVMIYVDVGIFLNEIKVLFVYLCLLKYICKFGLCSFWEYCVFVVLLEGVGEWCEMFLYFMINFMCFFCENYYFEYFCDEVLLEFFVCVKFGGCVCIWLVVCLDGQEFYLIVLMILLMMLNVVDYDIKIFVIDIDFKIFVIVCEGVYDQNVLEMVSVDMCC